MVPASYSGTLTNVLPYRNVMPQTQDMTPHPVTIYRHGVDLSLCYPLMWNVKLEYTSTHFNVLGQTRSKNPSPTFHTHQRTLNMMLLWWKLGNGHRHNTPAWHNNIPFDDLLPFINKPLVIHHIRTKLFSIPLASLQRLYNRCLNTHHFDTSSLAGIQIK